MNDFVAQNSQGFSDTSVIPRTIVALGGMARARQIRDEIIQEFGTLAHHALRLFEQDRGRIFRFWPDLSPKQRYNLIKQLSELDLDLLERNLLLIKAPETLAKRTAGELSPPEILEPGNDSRYRERLARGETVLENGWLAVVEGAGGTGSRFHKASGDHPKGLFGISPSRRYDFFEIRLARLIALRRLYGHPIPYIVMVSDATRDDTLDYFERKGYFGLRDEIRIIKQRSLPYLEEVSPECYDLVLERPDKVAVGGYGHADFTKHVLLHKDVKAFLNYYATRYVQWVQIDNPLACIGHRYLLGAHLDREPQLNPDALAMSFITLKKVVATEAAGVLVRRGGGLAVWEYSDMDLISQHEFLDSEGHPCVAVRRNDEVRLVKTSDSLSSEALVGWPTLPESLAQGLRYRWGAINPNLVVVSLASVEKHAEDNPPLAAKKSTAYLDEVGAVGDRSRKFLKFEAFLFDGFNDGVVVAEERGACFAPTKNSDGPVDSPQSTRQLLISYSRQKLLDIGWSMAPDSIAELDGLLELSSESLLLRIGRGTIESGALFSIHGTDVRIGNGLVVKAGAALVINVGEGIPTVDLNSPPLFTLPENFAVKEKLEYNLESNVEDRG